MLPSALTQRILQRFPGKLAYCFAYGSGVKKQIGYDEKAQKDAMIDLVVCVDNAFEWHAENLKKNPHDYSWMRMFGSNRIAEYQEYAAGVYCNTLIPIDKHTTIKYGVIRTIDLCEDLDEWTHLYVAGRMHKPIETLVEPTNPELKEYIVKNRDSALRIALLQLPKEFSYFQLFHAIANISYLYDFRMYFGEKKDKVKNIVEPQMGAFLKLYAPHLKNMSQFVHVPDLSKVSDQTIKQDKSHEAILTHLKALPAHCHKVIKEMRYPLEILAHDPKLSMVVTSMIGEINYENSIKQSLKNIPTAGLWKSIRYSASKALKTFSK